MKVDYEDVSDKIKKLNCHRLKRGGHGNKTNSRFFRELKPVPPEYIEDTADLVMCLDCIHLQDEACGPLGMCVHKDSEWYYQRLSDRYIDVRFWRRCTKKEVDK